MTPAEEVRAAALNAAVLHHKVMAATSSTMYAPVIASVPSVLNTAIEFELYITDGKEA